MKLVQKTLLASAVAVAFSSAAFADVTVSGKVAAEAQFISKLYNSESDALLLDSDGLKLNFDGVYDIIGGNQAGFHFGLDGNGNRGYAHPRSNGSHETGTNAWVGGQGIRVDKASLFVKGDWGTFAFGRLDVPSDSIKNDIWDNTQLAASNGTFAGGTQDNALAYSYGNDQFTVAAAVAAINTQYLDNTKANPKRKMVTGDQFVSDVAATVKVGPATLKAGVQYNANGNPDAGNSAVVNKPKSSKSGVVGVDADFGDVFVTGTLGVYSTKPVDGGKNKVTTDLLLGSSYKFNDVVTGKVTLTMIDLGDQNKNKLDPMQFAIGADYSLADNITAFTVLSYKNKDNLAKDAKDQVGVGTGLTVKF